MERLGVGCCGGDEHCYLHALSPQNLSHIPQRDLNLSFLSKATTFVTDCGGLLCFNAGDGRTVICNPTTQELKCLPPTPRLGCLSSRKVIAFGFGYDSTCDDYKVIRNYRLYSYELGENGMKFYNSGLSKFELYSLRHNSWREIPVPYGYPDGHPGPIIYPTDGSPYINGSIYWISRCTGVSRVLAFDFGTEIFSWISLPQHPPYTCFSLVKIDDDSLGVVLYSRGDRKFFELWMRRREVWTPLYDHGVFINNVEEPLGLKYGRLLFLVRKISRDLQQLVVYDWITKELKELDIYNYKYRNRMMIISYVESRVALPNAMPIGYYDNEASWDEYWRGYEAYVNEDNLLNRSV